MIEAGFWLFWFVGYSVFSRILFKILIGTKIREHHRHQTVLARISIDSSESRKKELDSRKLILYGRFLSNGFLRMNFSTYFFWTVWLFFLSLSIFLLPLFLSQPNLFSFGTSWKYCFMLKMNSSVDKGGIWKYVSLTSSNEYFINCVFSCNVAAGRRLRKEDILIIKMEEQT